MKTRVFHPENGENEIREAAQILRSGGLLGIPTETVYGLGASALNEDAVLHIFQAKGRPQDNPLIIHVPDVTWLERYCTRVPETAYRLAEAFWPGPLTMILPRKPIVPLRTTGGLDTVGVRCPDHPVTRAILIFLYEAAANHNLEYISAQTVLYATAYIRLVLLIGERRGGIAYRVEIVRLHICLVHRLEQFVELWK